MSDDPAQDPNKNSQRNTQTSEEIPVDTDQIIEEVTQEATDRVADQAAAKAAEKAAEVATKKVTDDFVKKITGDKDAEDTPPWEKEGRNPRSYKEVADWSRQQARKDFEAELETRDSKKAEAEKKQKEKTEVETQQRNQYWDQQLSSMTQEGKLPEVDDNLLEKVEQGEKLTEQELDHPYVRARKRIFELAAQHKEPNLELVYYKYFKPERENPPGANAPVFGSNRRVTPEGKDEFSYEEIHNAKEFGDLLPRGN